MGIEEMTDEQELAQLNSGGIAAAPISDEQELAELNGISTSPVRLPKWDDIKSRLPENIQATHGNKVKNALSISAGLDVPLSLSYDMHDSFAEKFKEANLWDKAQGSFKAGIGDVYSTMGNTMKWLGLSDESADVYTDFGERLRAAYIPPLDASEFTWGKMKDSEWWATTGVRSVPFTLSLIPAAIVGAYGGAAAAGVVGLGAFGTTILGAIGGAALSRPVESAFEAGGVYEEALARGMTEKDANEAANEAFMGNMALTGVDAAQFALAFTPLRVLGKNANKALSLRVLATTGKLGAIGLSEAGEERYQETISGKALGDEVSFFDLKDPRLNEASAMGAVFGIGLGGAGSVWTGLTNHVVNTMPEDIRAEYDTQVSEGKTDVQALDAIAATPEGKAHIEGAIETIKKATEETGRPSGITKEAPIEEPAPEPIPDLTPEEAAAVEQSTIEMDDLTERAVLDLISEGVDIETLTDEQIAERVQSYEQGAKDLDADMTASISQAKAEGKTFDEWVGGQGEYFHVTDSAVVSEIEKSGFTAQVGERSLGATKGKGIFLYETVEPTTDFAKNFSRVGKTPATIETIVSGKIFEATEDTFQSIRGLAEDTKFINRLKSQGYVGIRGDELGTPVTFIFEPKAIKTRSQLKAEWQTFEQAPFEQGEAALRMPVEAAEAPEGVSAGVSPETSVDASVEGQTPVYEAVYGQLKAALPVGTPETNIHAQATLWDSFFKTMGERAGVTPEELFQRYQVSIGNEDLAAQGEGFEQAARVNNQLAIEAIKRRGIKGDKLLDAEDLINDLAEKGGVINSDGTATLYHRTNPESAARIIKTGKMIGKEAGLFFGTRPTGQIEGYGDAVVKVRIPVEKIELNDVFSEEAHVIYKTTVIGREIPIGKAEIWEEGDTYEQSAYHGTPHKFTKFTLDHIGKGEGAQAYGWGLYFAESKKVAEFYREKLSEKKDFSIVQNGVAWTYDDNGASWRDWYIPSDDPSYRAIEELNTTGDISEARQNLSNETEALNLLNEMEIEGLEFKPGRLYKVNLTPEKDEYLDWDKPLSEQSEKVQAALSVVRTDEFDLGEGTDRENGATAYARISDALGSDQAASLYLKSIGIPGIKYLEGASRGKGEGYHNFVIFDEELIEIEEFYQKKDKTPRARISFGPDGVNISLLKDADLSSFLHETGHFFLKVMEDLGLSEGAPKDIKADLKTILDWLKVESVDQLGVKQHEKFARGFEKYLAEGKAPSVELRNAFARFREWLIEVYKQLKGLNVQLSDDVRAVMDKMLATGEEIKQSRKGEAAVEQAKGLVSTLPTRAVKGQVNQSAGVRKIYNLIREDKALSAAWKKAEQASRVAFREGKKEESAKWKAEMQRIVAKVKEKAAGKIAAIKTEKQKIMARRKQINTIVDFLGLSDSQVKKLVKKDIRLMTDYEYKTFKDNLLIRAVEMQEKAFEKARVMDIIERKRLEKVDNYRNAMGLPSYDKMTTEQLAEFADALEEFHEGDVFLTQRELETVDRTDLKGIKTWREAKEALARELGTSLDSLDTIKVTEFDRYRWDASLVDRNPFYKMLIEETTKSLMTAESRVHEVESRLFELARKSEKSRGRTLAEKIIPQDKQIFDYLEASADMKTALAGEMTPEQLDLANYMKEYFGQALEYLIKTKSLERGRENYITHIRRSFLEVLKDDGLGKAVLSVFQNYQQDEMVFNILDDDTGNILPLEKFFQFSMHRTGALDPTQNVVKAFLSYAKTFEKKVILDGIIPKLDIYAQSLTPRMYTPRGLETDRSLKKFVNEYINNKKGRQITWIAKQGGKIDLSIRAMRAFVTMLDLGFSIPVGLGTFVGEQIVTFEMTGAKGYALATKRMATKQGKAILKQYEHFTGRSFWEEFTAPGKEVGERLMEGMFGLFHVSTVLANKQFLLASLTKNEYNSGEISPERLAEIRIEMGRFRALPGTKSLVGSTAAGGAAMQYKTWAVVIARTLTKDMTTLASDLKNKPTGEALTSREAKELYRAIGLTLAALIVWGAGDDERDRSFMGTLMRKVRSESLTIIQSLSPDMWLSTPRLLGFISQLGKNLKTLILLEEYKTKPGLKGVGGLKRQLTPGSVRPLLEEKDKKPRMRVGG